MAGDHGATFVGVAEGDPGPQRRSLRRAGLLAVGLVVLAGLTGLVGVRAATVSGTRDGYSMSVQHAQVTRAGLAAPFHVRVTHPGGFDGPVQLAISEEFFEHFDFQNFYPNPSKETGSADLVYYEFDPPPGDDFEVHLDARTAPDQNGSTNRYRVALLVDGKPLIDLPFRLWVVP